MLGIFAVAGADGAAEVAGGFGFVLSKRNGVCTLAGVSATLWSGVLTTLAVDSTAGVGVKGVIVEFNFNFAGEGEEIIAG